MAIGLSGSNGGIFCLPKKIGKRGEIMINLYKSLLKRRIGYGI